VDNPAKEECYSLSIQSRNWDSKIEMRNRILFFLLVASGILFLPKFSLADGVIIQTPAQGHTVSITHTVSSFDIGTAAANVTIANTGMWLNFNPGISQANFCGRSDFGVVDINLHDNTIGQDVYSGQLAFDQGVYGTTGLSHIHDVTAGDDIRIDLNCDPSSATTTLTAGITGTPSVYWWNGNGMTQPQYDAMIAYMTSQLTVSSLHQYKSDASTTIAEGGVTTENSLVIKGIPTVASGTDELRLELEIQPFATAFTGTAMATSAATSSGNVVSLTIPSLANNHYHWRARVFDTTTNATSSWEEFGTSGNADFTIHTGGDTADLYYPVGYQWVSKNAQYCYDHFSTSSPACSGVTSATSSDNVYWGGLASDNTAISFSGYVSMLLYDASSTSQCASGWWGHTQDIVDASGTLTDIFDGNVAAVGGVICHNGGGAQTISGPITAGTYVVVWQNPVHKCADESLSQCLTDHGGDSDFSLTTLVFNGVFYAPIKNTSNGQWNLRSASSTSATILKTLPEDWIMYVESTTNPSGSPFTANGYHWYKVADPTDNVEGWMAGEDASSTTHYLSYDPSKQAEFEATSSSYIATSTRPDLILSIIDHYYNDANSANSLFSSNDSSGVANSNHLSIFKDRGYPEKVMWGIAAQETGGFGFTNDIVSTDYGHGIMQLTFNALGFEPSDPHATFDNRGEGSGVTIPPCASLNTSTYVNCYANAGSGDVVDRKPYQHYNGDSSKPIYKQYANTQQSLYANIKDGMRDLETKYDNNKVCDSTSSTITVASTVYSCLDREIVLTTAQYNGTSSYLGAVADKLENIQTYFPNQTSSDITDIINKLALAASSTVYAQLHSPGDLSIADSSGRVIGIVDGVFKNDFPFASYDPSTKSVHIFFPQDDNLTYKVVGTGTGTYGLDITVTEGGRSFAFRTRNVALTPNEIHTYTINKSAILNHEGGVTFKIDKNGDGIIDRVQTLSATVSNVPAPKLMPVSPLSIPRQTNFKFQVPSVPSRTPRIFSRPAVTSSIPNLPPYPTPNTSQQSVSPTSTVATSTLHN
jgi:hypothetical protein